MICPTCRGRQFVPKGPVAGFDDLTEMQPCPDCIGGVASCCDAAGSADGPSEAEIERSQRRIGALLDATPSFTCPRCGAVSYNPNDIRERYCGRCHVFVDDPAPVFVCAACGAVQRDRAIICEQCGEPLVFPKFARLPPLPLVAPPAARRRAEEAYRDDTFPERLCDRCCQLYRGPAVYCSLKCALEDAA